MDKKTRHKQEQIERMILYVLGRAPSEFGLLPDESGFVAFKDLRQALSEEEDWRFVKVSHLREMLLHDRGAHFEADGDRIRALERSTEIGRLDVIHPPKILHIGIRRRAWPHVAENGLKPFSGPWVVLARDKAMASRLGKRREQDPLLLEVSAEKAQAKGVRFFGSGKELVLVAFLPPEFLMGPPINKTEEEVRSKAAKPRKSAPESPGPGSFHPDLESIFPSKSRRGGKEKGGRKNDAAQDRKRSRQARNLKRGRGDK